MEIDIIIYTWTLFNTLWFFHTNWRVEILNFKPKLFLDSFSCDILYVCSLINRKNEHQSVSETSGSQAGEYANDRLLEYSAV
jgi:hypothetical protein